MVWSGLELFSFGVSPTKSGPKYVVQPLLPFEATLDIAFVGAIVTDVPLGNIGGHD